MVWLDKSSFTVFSYCIMLYTWHKHIVMYHMVFGSKVKLFYHFPEFTFFMIKIKCSYQFDHVSFPNMESLSKLIMSCESLTEVCSLTSDKRVVMFNNFFFRQFTILKNMWKTIVNVKLIINLNNNNPMLCKKKSTSKNDDQYMTRLIT